MRFLNPKNLHNKRTKHLVTGLWQGLSSTSRRAGATSLGLWQGLPRSSRGAGATSVGRCSCRSRHWRGLSQGLSSSSSQDLRHRLSLWQGWKARVCTLARAVRVESWYLHPLARAVRVEQQNSSLKQADAAHPACPCLCPCSCLCPFPRAACLCLCLFAKAPCSCLCPFAKAPRAAQSEGCASPSQQVHPEESLSCTASSVTPLAKGDWSQLQFGLVYQEFHHSWAAFSKA